jgi:hypothetical protein
LDEWNKKAAAEINCGFEMSYRLFFLLEIHLYTKVEIKASLIPHIFLIHLIVGQLAKQAFFV